MSKYIGLPSKSVVYLTMGGTPVPLVPYTGIVVKFCRSGDTGFTVKTLSAADWVEIGNGYYFLNWAPAQMSELGAFLYTVTGVAFNNLVSGSFEVDPVPLPLLIPPDTCIVTGSIVDIGGNPGKGQNIIFRPIDYPMSEGNSLVAADPVQTVPDILGNFQVALIQGKTILVQIDRTGINFQIVVPAAPSATLLSLLPPIPN
jgi:hypothetical protein